MVKSFSSKLRKVFYSDGISQNDSFRNTNEADNENISLKKYIIHERTVTHFSK